MKSDPESVPQALLNARRAVKQGDRLVARRWAEAAVAQNPDLEEPWLILAAVSNPFDSVTYLKRALQVNPHSERARKGMHWAAERLRKETSQRKLTRNLPVELERPIISQQGESRRPSAWSQVEIQPPAVVAQFGPQSDSRTIKSLAKYRWSFLSLLVLVVCVAAIWALWPGNASPALAFLHAPLSTHSILGAPNEVDKPTYTSTATPTLTPTGTFTPTPTFTLPPTPTETFTPTETYTPSLTPLPTDTPQPLPTSTSDSYPGNGGVRWIDVDLSQQVLYAYEGDAIVASFLISSGVREHPTVTGQFHIYVKYVSALMTGEDYYLPNVPYTMYFYKSYGIHGTYWHSNFGVPMSHGCINMYTPDAKWLYYWATEGTLVNVHY
jgi:lipoprotein-anchoring transpeptidase ErfK/SrfK